MTPRTAWSWESGRLPAAWFTRGFEVKVSHAEIPYGPARVAHVGVEVPPWKRLLDLVLVLMALPLWLPVMILIAGLVKLTSPGPLLFRQKRVGLRGASFVCLKFRTMKLHADTTPHENHLKTLIASGRPMTKMDALGDSRLIWGGRLLRASGLDELPQLLNVIRGEMSLVGPRPCTPAEREHFSEWHHARFEVLPGLMGLWQVKGKNRTTFSQMINLDLAYAQTYSLWLDLKIMIQTFEVVSNQVAESIRTMGVKSRWSHRGT